MRKVLGFVALSLGLILIAGAALVSWVFAPRLTVLPADTDALRVLGGNAAMLVNPTSLTGPTYGPGVLRDVPVTLWHGRHDAMVPTTHGEWLAERIPGARRRILEDEGHVSLVLRFDAILDELLAESA